MKQCLVCHATYSTSSVSCSNCGTAPAIVDGFEAYAPSLARGGGGFKASYFVELTRLEEANFWFCARNKLILWALGKYAPHFESMLEIGCGTGFVLSGIFKHFPNTRLKGSEIFIDGLVFAAKRLPSVHLMQMDARHIPFVNEFDVVGAFDVLEHIKEDEIAISQVYKAIKPEGFLLVTVPQHTWLWSAVDEYAFHERRYASVELENKLKVAGFRIRRSTSFVTTLLPAMFISRMVQRLNSKKFNPIAEFKIHPLLNRTFEQLLIFELVGIKLGMNYPIGGSRLIVAQKA